MFSFLTSVLLHECSCGEGVAGERQAGETQKQVRGKEEVKSKRKRFKEKYAIERRKRGVREEPQTGVCLALHFVM